MELDHEQVIRLEYDKNQRHFEDEIADRSSIEDVAWRSWPAIRRRSGPTSPTSRFCAAGASSWTAILLVRHDGEQVQAVGYVLLARLVAEDGENQHLQLPDTKKPGTAPGA